MIRSLLVSLILCAPLVACVQSDRPLLEDVYYPLTREDLDEVRSVWAARDLSARSIEIVHEGTRDDFKLTLVRHKVAADIHYGAIVAPIGDLTDTPVAVVASGLN